MENQPLKTATIGAMAWMTAIVIGYAAEGQIGRATFLSVSQSSDASATNGAALALDGANTTYSLTADAPGSFWTAELARPYALQRLELVNRPAPKDNEMAGLSLRLLDIDDQVVYQIGLTNPGPSRTNLILWPAGLRARKVWLGLTGSQTNGGGNHRVGLAEARLFGQLDIPYGPAPWVASTNTFRVYQSSDYSSAYPASNAVDGDATTFSHTLNYPNSFWMADLGQSAPIDRIELVNRLDCCAVRMTGLVARLFDGASNSVASATITNPGAGGTWVYFPPSGTMARYLRVGLENGKMNADGNYYVTLAEARAFWGATNLLSAWSLPPAVSNLASFKASYMVRLLPTLPAATNANDNNLSTDVRTTTQTVDAYWETDLGASYALYGVRAIAASGIGYRLTNTMVRLFDGDHNSVFARKLTGTPDVFDEDLNGPIFARFVRIGLEDKQRTDPSGGLEWYIGMREVEVFGRPTNAVGILSFSTSASQVALGQPVTLSWTVDDVRRLEIHPGIGSVGAYTDSSGAGSITFTPTNSNEYLLVASNAAGVFTRALAVGVGSAPLPVRINELVAANQFSLTDGYGNTPDWVELRNPGSQAVDLTGYGLSDDAALPMKWVFPATNLAPNSALVVFASGQKTPFDPAGNLHASFSLNSAGGALVLTAPDGKTTVDGLMAYPALDTDLAYGRDVEGNWCFLEPTPGTPNLAATYAGWLRPLVLNHDRGFCAAPFTLTLSNLNAGGTVYYSLDGSVPSLPYTKGLAISHTVSVRAQVTRPGFKPARIQTSTFIFINDVITSPNMQTAITQNPAYAQRMKPGLLALPSVSLVLPGLPGYEEVDGSIEVLWPNGQAPVQANCGVSRFGGSWEDFAKKSFRIKCHPRLGINQFKTPLFSGFDRGVLAGDSFDELEFRCGSQDMVERGFYMAGPFVEDLMLDMGTLNPHTRFVHVYLNGVYWGQYDAREPLIDSFLARYLGGSPSDYVNVRGNDNVGDTFIVGTPDPPNNLPWVRAVSLEGSYAKVRPYLDVTNLIDFMLMWFYGDCESEYRASGPLTAGTGFKFWEADADGFLRTDALGLNRVANVGPSGLFGGLVAEGNSDFKTLMADLIYRHFFNGGALTPQANKARLASRMLEINDSLLAECARWGYQTPASWTAAASAIQTSLFPARTSQLFTMLRAGGLYPAIDPPAFNLYGGLVTNGFTPVLAAAAGTIYYTLDGSDPRLPGGGISPSALVWSAGAATLTQDTLLSARLRAPNGQWSALAQPQFILAPRYPPTTRELLITEINYNPPGPDDCEFVELYNRGTNMLDLSGVTLSNAVRFMFPKGATLAPGAFVVVVKDPTAFAARYQTSTSPWYWPGMSVAGPWEGSLGNSGETVSLIASNGVALSSVPYQASGDWPTRADGRGSSLELASLPPPLATDQDVRTFLANGQNWNPSSLYNGSPGRFDVFTPSARINELLSHPSAGDDWIELLNRGAQAVDLTGCSLTDDISAPSRWVFPTNSILAPGQFLVLSSSQLGFGFSSLGESAFLLQVSGTNILRILDSVDFPAADHEVSFGLFERSDGELDFTELRSPTPGAANALPQVGPVVMSEIMSSPGPGMAQYIELSSITNGPVALFDPLAPTNGWTIQGPAQFAFPSGAVLDACSSVIVCSTNPAAFRAQYAPSSTVAVFGPWSGTLAADATITLLRPGKEKSDGTTPYYRVDHVAYSASGPWPQTSPGISWQRIPVEAYGNDPASWQAGPTNGIPGIPSANRPPVINFIGVPIAVIGQLMELTVSVADLDAPWRSITLTAEQLPPGSAFDAGSDKLSWTPATTQTPGNYTAQFTASDNAACGPGQTTAQVVIQLVQPLALSAQIQQGALQLSFPSAAGETYQVQYSDDLESGNWQVLQEFTGLQTNRVTTLDPTVISAGARFYRVQWLR